MINNHVAVVSFVRFQGSPRRDPERGYSLLWHASIHSNCALKDEPAQLGSERSKCQDGARLLFL